MLIMRKNKVIINFESVRYMYAYILLETCFNAF